MIAAVQPWTDEIGPGPESYERYFVPTISRPLAGPLLDAADLRPGERVLDLACGTGLLARMATERVGAAGQVAGLDLNPGMLELARASVGEGIDWYETAAEATPLSDDRFDVALCQMGLQFFSDRERALKELHRVLRPGGRVVLNVPGPSPTLFMELRTALRDHVGAASCAFVDIVFCLHAPDELTELLEGAGFEDVDVCREHRTLRLPPPEAFLWQYINSTPLGALASRLDEEQRAALTADVRERWRGFESDGGMLMPLDVTTARARKGGWPRAR